MSFCRITGKSRNLPKPNFFPIIPPISPADARRLCRITAKRMDYHNYVPLIEIGRRPECTKNKALEREKDSRNTAKSAAPSNHFARKDFKYVTPVLKKEVMTDESDAKAFEELQKILTRLKKGLDSEGGGEERNYVYLMPSMLCGLIVPAEVEEAIRKGELEAVSVSKKCDRAVFKVKGRPTLFVPLKQVDVAAATAAGNLFDGLGQSRYRTRSMNFLNLQCLKIPIPPHIHPQGHPREAEEARRGGRRADEEGRPRGQVQQEGL